MSETPLIGFLSDYGLRDEFVGVCHGVIAAGCPGARVIDICHELPRHDVRAGALMLAAALPYLPAGVALAIIDPGVGSQRRAIALETADERRVLVGPDNGLLMPAAARFGGAAQAFDIGSSPVAREPLSATFHGRDLFAPVAAAAAAGESLQSLGEPLEGDALAPLQLPSAQLRDGALVVHVLRVDGFGNLALDADPAQLEPLALKPGAALEVHTAQASHEAVYVRAFAHTRAGALLLYVDSQGALALAVNLGSAADLLGSVAIEGELLLVAQ